MRNVLVVELKLDAGRLEKWHRDKLTLLPKILRLL